MELVVCRYFVSLSISKFFTASISLLESFLVVSNPFGPPAGAQPVVGVASPFMTMGAPAGYGFYNAAPPMSVGAPASAVAYGSQQIMYTDQNAMPMTHQSSYMSGSGLPSGPQAIPQQQTQFGTWNQPTGVANPFMVCGIIFLIFKCCKNANNLSITKMVKH